jgi:hypothetical protein
VITPKRRSSSIHGIPAGMLSKLSPSSTSRQLGATQPQNGPATAFNMTASTSTTMNNTASMTAPSSPTHGTSTKMTEAAAARRQRTLTRMREIQQRFADTTTPSADAIQPLQPLQPNDTHAATSIMTAPISPDVTRAEVRSRIGRRAHSPEGPPPISLEANGLPKSRRSAPASTLAANGLPTTRVTLAMSPVRSLPSLPHSIHLPYFQS